MRASRTIAQCTEGTVNPCGSYLEKYAELLGPRLVGRPRDSERKMSCQQFLGIAWMGDKHYMHGSNWEHIP